jgi:D-proline reductase (dithiol) PrdB
MSSLPGPLEALQKRIRQRWYAGFAWVVHETAPWSPAPASLAGATIALVSTCGIYRLDHHVPFDAWHDLGDPSFREIHVDTPPERLRIAHSHYDSTQAAADLNVVLPIAHFRRLAADGVIGGLHPWAYSFMGYLAEPAQLIRETAPEVARRLRAEGVDAAFLTPC